MVALKNPQFLSPANIQNMARLIGTFGVFSIGVGIVIITGGIDLSVGSVFALLGVLLSMMLTEWHWPPAAAVSAVLGLGAGLGCIHGLLITRLRLQPFIVTLCGLLLYRGIARYIAEDTTKGFGSQGFQWLRNLATGSVLSIPMPFVLLMLVAAAMGVMLHRSIYGRHLFAVGRNAEAARYSGINTNNVITAAYMISGSLRSCGNPDRVFTRTRLRRRRTAIFMNSTRLPRRCSAVAASRR
jgi:ribose transport system permease protein